MPRKPTDDDNKDDNNDICMTKAFCLKIKTRIEKELK